MDDRQQKIKENAGLEESRVNQEFLDFLSKWSSPVLLTLAVAALVWAGLQYLERQKIARVNQAFSELESATQGGNPSPSSLKNIAGEYSDVRAIPHLALLTTVDLYINASVMGVEVGAEIDQITGLPLDDSDLLSDDERSGYLNEAQKFAQQVLDETKADSGKALISMQAMSRLAAIFEGKREFENAKGMYEQLNGHAESNAFPAISQFASSRIENLAMLEGLEPLISQEQLIALPGEEIFTLPPVVPETEDESESETTSDDESVTDDASDQATDQTSDESDESESTQP